MSARIFGLDTIPDVKMRAKLEKQGDTLALRITEGAEELAGLPEGAEVGIALESDMAEEARRRALALEKMLEDVAPENRHELIDYGPAVGKDVNSSPSPAHLTHGQEGEMGNERGVDQSAVEEEWRPGKPVPGAMQWLKDHGDEYAGEWVAIGPRGLVAHGATFEEMENQLPSLMGVLIMQLV